MAAGDFNPNSIDAQLARILVRLENQDTTLGEILTQTKATNGRVTKLEGDRKYLLGLSAGVAGAIATVWQVVTAFL